MQWDPGQYLRYSDLRGRPFVELTARIGAQSPSYVADLGCGTGELTAMLAELRAGGLYLPLDPAHPRERMDLILEDARPALLLTRRGLGHDLPAGQGRTVFLDVFLDGGLETSAGAPARRSRRSARCWKN